MKDIKKNTVVLFNPNPRGYKGEEDVYCVPPMSLLAIAAPLVEAGYDVKIVDQTVDKDYKEKVLSYVPEMLCLGVTSMTGHQIRGGIEVSRAVKEVDKSIPIVWGGYHPSIFPEETIKSKYVDFVVVGQGETTFLKLLQAIKGKEPFKEIKGMVYKEDNGNVLATPPRKPEDINNFPPTPYFLIDINKYIVNSFGKKTFGIRTSQGCPYRCGFCAEVNVTKRSWSGFKAERILGEMEYLIKNYNIDDFMIYDPNFFVDKERVKKILKGIIDKKWKISLGNINGRTEQLVSFEDEMWLLLKEAGCNDILIGAESGSGEILDYIKKDTTVENTIKVKKIFHKYGIQPFVSLILGFPRSKDMNMSIKDEFNKLLDLVDKLNKIDYQNHIRIWLYTPYAGTPLYESALKNYGLKMPDSLDSWAGYNLTEVNVSWIPKRYHYIINQLNNYIFPYTSEHFSYNWKIKKSGINNAFKYVIHNALHLLALIRLKFRFFDLPFEYLALSYWKMKKFKL